MTAEPPDDLKARLRDGASRAETLDTINLAGLSHNEIWWLKAAVAEVGGVGSYDVTGMSNKTFITVMLSNEPPRSITPEQLEIGRKLLAERRGLRDRR
jgi:hypothetical protein